MKSNMPTPLHSACSTRRPEDVPFGSGLELRLRSSPWLAGLRALDVFGPSRYLFPGFASFNVRYLSRLSNRRLPIKHWTGNQGDGRRTCSAWRMSARKNFLRGGSLHDMTLTSELHFGCDGSVCTSGQFERWRFPLLFSNSANRFLAPLNFPWPLPSGGH